MFHEALTGCDKQNVRSRHLLWCGGLVLAASVCAQPVLQLKQGSALALESPGSNPLLKRKNASRSHLVLQFEQPPEPELLAELGRRGVGVVGYVPDNGLVVSAPDGARLDDLGLARIAAFSPGDKISAMAAALGGEEAGHYVVEFHADVDPDQARQVATESGLRIREHPDLLRHQLLVAAMPHQLFALAEWDEVAYIFPASADLAEGRPVVACAGAVTPFAALGQYVALVGKGWSADANGSVTLQYHLDRLSAKLPADQTGAEIVRALNEWARHARLSFVPGSSATASRTINVLFASGAHGDPYPFDGAGRTLAHTFYPAPPNPEPLAGDVHLDDDESWRIGADTDVYSVVLHELGHALGLGHSDTPGTVMYPFYRRAGTLTAEDISALQQLYAPPATTPPADPAPPAAPAPSQPLSLTITTPGASWTTSAGTVTLAGTLSGGTAPLRLAWSSDRGYAGTAAAGSAWTIAGVPLADGRNGITVVAADALGQQAVRSVTVTRESAASAPPPPVADTVAPSLTITSPASVNVLTSGAAITLRGTARDNVGVTEVTWSSSSGSTGLALGTTSWSVSDLPLRVGANTITVRARDAAGNTAWRAIVVTRR
jgi:hypothetical protein